MKFIKFSLGVLLSISMIACGDDDNNQTTPTIEFRATSQTPNFVTVGSDFAGSVSIFPILTSEDRLSTTPNFIYGSMADGAGLLGNDDGTFTLINNIEADFSVARITFDESFTPVGGEYILNATATGKTAQCSGTLITPEEHGFGPLYLSGGEWGIPGNYSPGVYSIDPFRPASDASIPVKLSAMGEWVVENAVPLGKDAYTSKTVVLIGDDDSGNSKGEGQLAMYVGDRGDLNGGKLYGLKVVDANSDAIINEVDMIEGTEYSAEWVELLETELSALQTESETKNVMGFQRVEDIDWRRGSAANQREVYFAATGRDRDALNGVTSISGRVYKLVMNDSDPIAGAKITCVLDGDVNGGIANEMHSPDNILATENFVYIQEDPNGVANSTNIPNAGAKNHFPRVYQYNIATGALRTVFEADQTAAAAAGYGNTTSTWEFTGMIDISDIVNVEGTFLLITQNHGWEDNFTDPNANPDNDITEGSMLFVVTGLDR